MFVLRSCWFRFIKYLVIYSSHIGLLDDDEARRCEKRRVAPSLEENVYYISHEEIQKRKVPVSDLPAFVADKTMAYYEEEFDVSGKCFCLV